MSDVTNAPMTLHPYQIGTTWVFDDPRTGLKEEAFVLGMSEIISRVVTARGIADAGRGFTMHFSSSPFDECDAVVSREYPESGGTWYSGEVFGQEMRGWLCPALFLYFRAAPERIYMKAETLAPGVDPIWEPEGQPTRQFVSPSGF